MISKNLKDYVFRIDNFLTNEFCNKLIDETADKKWHLHEFYNAPTKTSKSYDTDLSVQFTTEYPTNKLFNKLNDELWHGLLKYVNNYDIPWFKEWSGYTWARINKYAVTKEMRLHCDHIHSIFDGERKGVPILTILGSLNDDYEGGELVMWDEVYKMPTGSVLIFPSNFLYPHKVNPVKSGVRYSYVSWAW